MQRIDEIEGEPVVGQVYLVPCVTDPYRRAMSPVLLPAHDDPELGFVRHYHYDRRFTFRPTEFIPQGATDSPYERVDANSLIDWEAHELLGVPEWLPRECQRRMADFPAAEATLSVLQPLYAETVLRPGCRVCPHRGMPLENLPVDAEGCVVCPMHGLKWNLQTGRMVERELDPRFKGTVKKRARQSPERHRLAKAALAALPPDPLQDLLARATAEGAATR